MSVACDAAERPPRAHPNARAHILADRRVAHGGARRDRPCFTTRLAARLACRGGGGGILGWHVKPDVTAVELQRELERGAHLNEVVTWPDEVVTWPDEAVMWPDEAFT